MKLISGGMFLCLRNYEFQNFNLYTNYSIMNYQNLLSLIATTGVIATTAQSQPNQQKPYRVPNIVFIYADDLGYGDPSCYGNAVIKTPNLDQMARDGARFTNFYSCSPVCSPSRAGLLTGRYQVRSGITEVLFPNSSGGIDSSEVTIAELLKTKGYATGIIGKWHLGHLPQYLPEKHGFDYWFGLPYSNDMEWEPRKDPPLPLMRDERVIDQPAYQNTLTQRYTTEAINFISKHKNHPFFLYFPHTFPHVPLHVSAEFRNTSPSLYGDVVQELDKSVGDVLNTLKFYGLEENTIVVFSSDNGPGYPRNVPDSIGHGSAGSLKGWKATTFEGGIKEPTIVYWKGKIKPGTVISDPAIMLDWFPTFARLAGCNLPNDRIIDGKDLSGLLLGKAKREGSEFYFYFDGQFEAMRSGKWKYKKAHGDYRQKDLTSHGDLLYNLEEDPNETTDLIDKYPKEASELKLKMEQFIDNLGSLPKPKTQTYLK